MPPATQLISDVIVVDDDPAVLNSLKFSLEIDGFTVRNFHTGRALLEKIDSIKSGCMVVDYRLPDMNGLELLDELRHRQVRVPALLITSHPSPALRKRANDAGVPIIEKPLLGNLLLNAIRNALGRSS